MDIETAAGGKVVFTGENGYDYDQKQAHIHLTVGQELTVAHIDVSSSSSSVTFEECPKVRFNTVMFKNNTPTWDRFHWFAHCYLGVKETTQEEYATMPFDEHHMSDAVLAALDENPLAGWTHEAVLDAPTEMGATVEADITAALIAQITREGAATHGATLPPHPVEAAKPVQNKIITMSRRSGQELSVLNPKSDEEAAEHFMNMYGDEPTSYTTVWFGQTFRPSDIRSSNSCHCDC